MSKKTMSARSDLAHIPAVQTVMRALSEDCLVPTVWLKTGVRDVLAEVRQSVKAGAAMPSWEEILLRCKARAEELTRPHLRPVINATGIMVHTNLGRSPLPEAMMEHLAAVATGYSTLEYRLDEGVRGSRHEHVQDLLADLVGAPAAMVVNNNAAAVLIALTTMASGREVIVSRGELVEIGGSFRIPEVMALSGARLVEVGATNKTHLYDYERAITAETALLLKVHQSNFRQLGFVDSVSRHDLVVLGRRHKIPVMEDLGSGVLLPITIDSYSEPCVQEVVGAGVDITTFSGDKLLGGPQAGLVVGKKEWIDRMKKNPLARAVRVDKMTLAVLELVLRWYREDRGRDLPLWRMIYMPLESIFSRAQSFADALRNLCPDVVVEVEADWSEVGGGSMPGARLQTYVVSVELPPSMLQWAEQALRSAPVAVIVRVNRGRLLLDLRTVFEHQEIPLAQTLADVLMRVSNG